MKKFLIPIIVFLVLPLSSVESKEVNCNSPVWKKKEICKDKISRKKVYVMAYGPNNHHEVDDIQKFGIPPTEYRDAYEYKGKIYVATKLCPEGTNMIWYSQNRFLRSTQVFEKGCLTPDKAKIFALEMQLKNARRGGGGGGTYKNNYAEGWNQQQQLYQSIDNFHNTGSFYPQPNFGF